VNWHFLTIGIGAANYENAARRLSKEAAKSKYFSSVITETNSTLQLKHSDFLDNHSRFMNENQTTGYGNFLWKPYLVNHWMNRIPEGDGLLYLDSGCSFNLKSHQAKKRFEDYLETALIHGSLVTQLISGQFGIDDLTEKSWTTAELADAMELSEGDKNSNQIQAGILFLISNSKNREIVKKWWDFCVVEDYKYLRNSIFENPRGVFRQNRHDQSIFSCLAKKFEVHAIPDETYFYPAWYSIGRNYPIWAMRNRSGLSRNSSINKYIPARLINAATGIHNALLRVSND
jgi:hypothetical protein